MKNASGTTPKVKRLINAAPISNSPSQQGILLGMVCPTLELIRPMLLNYTIYNKPIFWNQFIADACMPLQICA